MFGLINYGIWILLFILGHFCLKKAAHQKRAHAFLAVGILAVGIPVMLLTGNYLLSFSSPEKAFQYSSLPTTKVDFTLEGKDSALVLSSAEAAKFTLTFLPKEDGRWKLSDGASGKVVTHTIAENYSIALYQYRNSDDFYLLVSGTSAQAPVLEDNRDSVFSFREREISISGEKLYTSCVYLVGLDADYSLFLNGKEISLP